LESKGEETDRVHSVRRLWISHKNCIELVPDRVMPISRIEELEKEYDVVLETEAMVSAMIR
jgi:hypothetical protein